MADLSFEQPLATQGYRHIAGLDEAGRGALAGPVSAAAVVLPLEDTSALEKLSVVNDSKKISAKKRDEFDLLVREYAFAFGVSLVPAAVVDRDGIISATKQAMRESLAQLSVPADYLLIDGRIRLASLPTPQQSIVRGDSKSLSIACASILAKVARDRWMLAQHDRYPEYAFAQHKGYGTAQHVQAITEHGPCEIHRMSFAPMRDTLV